MGGTENPLAAAEFETGCAEIQQKTGLDAGGGEMVDELGLVSFGQGRAGCDFDDQFTTHDQIRHVAPHQRALISHRQLSFTFELKALGLQFVREGIRVNGLEESGAEDAMDLHGRADYLAGEVILLRFQHP